MIGSERFPYVIAATGAVKEKMELSKNSENGLYTIRPLGIDVGRTAPFVYTPSNETSLLVQLKNSWVTTFQDYEIIVNPSGCGNWLDGSVESVLESVWCSNLYYGNYDVNKEVKDFYERFYRHSLTSDQLSDVLDGN